MGSADVAFVVEKGREGKGRGDWGCQEAVLKGRARPRSAPIPQNQQAIRVPRPLHSTWNLTRNACGARAVTSTPCPKCLGDSADLAGETRGPIPHSCDAAQPRCYTLPKQRCIDPIFLFPAVVAERLERQPAAGCAVSCSWEKALGGYPVSLAGNTQHQSSSTRSRRKTEASRASKWSDRTVYLPTRIVKCTRSWLIRPTSHIGDVGKGW